MHTTGHNAPPRFGHSSNITGLLLGSQEQAEDYVQGVAAASILIAAFVVAWFIVLVVLKCLGPQRVGLLSGRLYHPDWQRQEDEARLLQQSRMRESNDQRGSFPSAQIYDDTGGGGGSVSDEEEQRRRRASFTAGQKRRLRNTRIVVLLCSLGIVACAILMLTKGVESLYQASDNAIDGIAMGRDLASEALDVIDAFLLVAGKERNVTRGFLQEINGFCPREGRPDVCIDPVAPVLDCDFEFPYGPEIEELVDSRTTLVQDELLSLRGDVEEIEQVLGDLRQSAGTPVCLTCTRARVFVAIAFPFVHYFIDWLILFFLFCGRCRQQMTITGPSG